MKKLFEDPKLELLKIQDVIAFSGDGDNETSLDPDMPGLPDF